ncbi:MAG: arylesterase [Pseudomonadota bacterium]
MRPTILMMIVLLAMTACGGDGRSEGQEPDETKAASSSNPQSSSPSAGAQHTTAQDSNAQGNTRAQASESASFKVVMLGDSLTAGFGLPPEAALPEQLEKWFRAKGEDIEFINAGVSGDTTAGGLARYDFSVRAVDPDLLIIALGANDFLNGLDASIARDNLSEIISNARDDAVPVVLFGLMSRSQNSLRESEFANMINGLSEEYKIPLYSEFLASVQDKPELLQPDGLHPTADGVIAVADETAQFLQPIVAELLQEKG